MQHRQKFLESVDNNKQMKEITCKINNCIGLFKLLDTVRHTTGVYIADSPAPVWYDPASQRLHALAVLTPAHRVQERNTTEHS